MSTLFPCSMLLFLVTACSYPKQNPNPEVQKTLGEPLPDSSISITFWKNLQKQFINIDSSTATAFVFQTNVLEGLKDIESFSIQKIDLNGDGRGELFLSLEEGGVKLYQQQEDQAWVEIWEGYESDAGHLPEIITAPFVGIKINYYSSCSHCSDAWNNYYILEADKLKHIFTNHHGFNYDTETKGTHAIYEGANSNLTYQDDFIHLGYTIELQELKTNTIFVEDSVTITYLWDTVNRDLLLHTVNPQDLSPYLSHWKQEERKDNFKEEPFDDTYISSNVVLRAYYDWKRKETGKTAALLTNQEAIEELEEWYGDSWKKIMYHWGKHSFVAYDFKKE